MADTKKLKKTVGKSAVRNTIQISAGDRIYYAIVNVLLGVFTIIVLMPLLNVLASSFSSPEAVNYGWVLFWPVDFSLEGYEAVFEYKGLWQAYGNTFFYAIVGTALNITMTMVCAYPMARKNLPGRKWITWLFMFTMYFGGGTIPNYVLVRSLGMMDTRAAMIIPGAMSVYNMIIARTFINNIPSELEEAAKVDGAKVIGVDVDQAAIIDGAYGEGMTVTSAMKGLAPTVKYMLGEVLAGNFANHGGKIETLGLVSGDDPEANYVQIPMESTQWSDSFTQDDYKALVAGMFDGTIVVSNDTTAEPAVTNVVVDYQGQIVGG